MSLISSLLAIPEVAALPAAPAGGITTLAFLTTGELYAVSTLGTNRVFPASVGMVIDILQPSGNTANQQGTWTKPSGAGSCHFVCIGGGGGGGGGAQNTASGTLYGGGGGIGGLLTEVVHPASQIASSLSYQVGGRGNAGGVAAAGAASVGAAGVAGGHSFLGSTLSGNYFDSDKLAPARGGTGGIRGSSANESQTLAVKLVAGQANHGTTRSGLAEAGGACGGFGSITTASAIGVPGSGGYFYDDSQTQGGNPGTSASKNGGQGLDGLLLPGQGGGGGYGSITGGQAGAGGNGGGYGGGGGGGGSCWGSACQGGIGGLGGSGIIVILTKR